MRLLSSILNRIAYPCLGRAGYFRRRAGKLSVLTYHGVLPEGYQVRDSLLDGHLISARDFRRQLRLLKTYYSVISPACFRSWLDGKEELPPRAILLTCDDGLLNIVTDFLPILQDEQLSCLFFVTSGFFDQSAGMLWYEELYLMLMDASAKEISFSSESIQVRSALGSLERKHALWSDLVLKLSSLDAHKRQKFLGEMLSKLGLGGDWQSAYLGDPVLCRRFGLLTRSQVVGLAQAGMTIGAHTASHPVLSQQPHDLAQAELVESRKSLENVVGCEVWAVAYPFGTPQSAGEREFKLAEAAGYRCAFVNFGGALGTDCSRFSLPRIHISEGIRLSSLEAYVSGFHWSLQQRFAASPGGSASRGIGL